MSQLNLTPSLVLLNKVANLNLHRLVREFEQEIDRMVDFHRAQMGLSPIDRKAAMNEFQRMGASQ